ncbi:hypothetical protein N6H14_14770 [Paenibacillus sp. CC-CFT747]|nr:hypothetical protein N6H14_14770 [Paenibacillus sp. CC-CFT747]
MKTKILSIPAIKHITCAEQILSPALIKDRTAIHLGSELEANPAGKVTLQRSVHNVSCGPLCCDNQMNSDVSGTLSKTS